MKKAQEYKILPQIEEDNFYIEDRRRQGWLYCCVGFLVVLLIAGIGATVVILFGWTDDVYQTLREYVQGAQNMSASLGSLEKFAEGENVTVMPENITSSEDYYYTTSWEVTGNGTSPMGMTMNGTTTTESPWVGINKYNAGVKFAESMRKIEKTLERLSGIHQPELVIPLFMLMLFMGTLAIISLCCCVMTKQREKKQRKLLGKIITDLHTGDSKTVLLGRDDDL